MSQSKWYNQAGAHNDMVVSTRIRLARNFSDYLFSSRLTEKEQEEIYTIIRSQLPALSAAIEKDLGFYAPDAVSIEAKRAMAERHLIGREFAESGHNRAMLLSEDESVCALLCDTDHLRLQVLSAGLELEKAYDIINRFDDMIGSQLAYAFDKTMGFLTESPTDLGTGMKASVLLHLPAMEATKEINTLAKAVSKIGLTLQGTFGEGSTVSGSLYQLSNRITMGIDEQSALENLRCVTEQVMLQENQARQNLSSLQIEDAAYRGLGLLQNARTLTLKEFSNALSHLRLGVSMGLVPHVSIETINQLNAQMHPATLLLQHPDADSTEKRDVIRATKVREQLS
ncbi:MAG: ATP--guanido phosphotransferase [Clostridia bacterium]|nr:ATP--guanido phosphotransferase [Clostridia bacterium]